MKKFFPLCLLLIIALIWTVSIADTFDRLPTSSSDEQATVEKKSQTSRDRPEEIQQPVRERSAVSQQPAAKGIGWEVPARMKPSDRMPTTNSGESDGATRINSERAGEIVVAPIISDQRVPSRNRMKEIKRDGVISSDERELYGELLSQAPGVELPTPLNIVSESEPNDSCHTANLVACGDTVWCATLTAGQDNQDWYTFTLATDQRVTIETHPTAGACDPQHGDTWLELWTGDCQTMLADNDDKGGSPWSYYSRIIIDLAAGIYAINSDNYWGNTGSYHMSVICEEIPPIWNCVEDPPAYILPPGKSGGGIGDIEPNDSCADASMAQCEYAYCGALSSETDVDWYYIDLPADTSYALHIRVLADDTPNQYAYGGGCDPWVGLYASDCATLVAGNEDYFGTFPDAEVYDSQIDPGYPNCFNAGERVYIEILTNYNDPGPYLLIINCEPCEIPQTGCPEDSLTIELVTDNWPSETTWEVIDQSNSAVVCSGGPYGLQNTAYTEVCCLDSDGCYDFYIYDSYGDGGASYDLYFNGVLFYSSDGNYGYGESVQYIGNGCPEPTGACCVSINCVGTITQDSCDALSGDWYIDEDCATFECPYGACCLQDGLCTSTTNGPECDALGGTWYEFEICPNFECPTTSSCDTAIYHNGDPTGGGAASQCAPDYPFAAEVADDFVLPGAGTIGLSEVISWVWFWNGPPDASPAEFLGVNVTIYANDAFSDTVDHPGGKPIDGDTLCQHTELIPNGIVYNVELLPGEFTYFNEGTPMWKLNLPIDVALNAGEIYWLGISPILPFGVGGQCGWVPTDSLTGNPAQQIFELLGTNTWTPLAPETDMAFCLLEAPPPVWSCIDDPPGYIPPEGKQPGGNRDIEPNDTCTLSGEALCEYAYCGDLLTSDDVDWYYVDLPNDTTYALHIRVFANDTPNQYAYGGGLDPWVGLYGSDCTTLLAANEDYGGTFPDAENFDSQIDPGGFNCFNPGERVYIQISENYGTAGPYLLIINCVPCDEVITGACCVNEQCLETNTLVECNALGGTWYEGFACPDFECPVLRDCEDPVYHNGDPDSSSGAFASQCDPFYPFAAETADDFVLPGAGPTTINHVVAWFGHWNGNVNGPGDYLGVNVTIYANDTLSMTYAVPGGKPVDGDPNCTHTELVPGGIIYTVQLAPYEYTYVEDSPGQWRLSLPIDVSLQGGETYWLGVQPIMGFGAGGQSGWLNTLAQTGNIAVQIFELLGTVVWTPLGAQVDMAFCLLGPSGCDYTVGDVNGSNNYNGLDITYGVNFFKGIGPAPQCPFGSCPIPPCDAFYYCGDVNASCNYNGLDITYGVAYFKGGSAPIPCPACPPVGGPASDNSGPEELNVIKTKTVIEKNPGLR